MKRTIDMNDALSGAVQAVVAINEATELRLRGEKSEDEAAGVIEAARARVPTELGRMIFSACVDAISAAILESAKRQEGARQ